MPNASSLKPSVGALALERATVVIARTGISRSELYRKIALGQFPAPIKLGQRSSAWIVEEVDSWIRKRAESRQAVRQ
ncbi:helix-turn-helix transcriptional regulator [Luteimonas fraxinea]|uniref:helix-turn-helix transcriptional regulator n=1 Tax=Luteimonas fraxinea TaxID=2901869 RepID=UPI001E58F684|nr:AlpA family phage regulatory protein [Luteimonas fraxinea]MCD9126677.1 AlpA family phage regulatory protein [Luteimonas fraxinea]